MVNCNPETVSTDYDTSDRLYFEPVTLEDVLEIVDQEKPWGVIVQYGTNAACSRATSPGGRGADHRHKRRLDRRRRGPRALPAAPRSSSFRQFTAPRAARGSVKHAEAIGYPVVVRPSYVLGGRAMEIVHQQSELERYMKEAVKVSNDSPVLLDRYLV